MNNKQKQFIVLRADGISFDKIVLTFWGSVQLQF